MVESERLRSAVLAAIFAVLMVAFPLVAWIFHDDYRRYFSSYATLGWATGVTGALVAYELLVRYLLGRMLERGIAPPAALRFWNALIETSVPTLLMVLVARELDPHIVLQGPPVFL